MSCVLVQLKTQIDERGVPETMLDNKLGRMISRSPSQKPPGPGPPLWPIRTSMLGGLGNLLMGEEKKIETEVVVTSPSVSLGVGRPSSNQVLPNNDDYQDAPVKPREGIVPYSFF